MVLDNQRYFRIWFTVSSNWWFRNFNWTVLLSNKYEINWLVWWIDSKLWYTIKTEVIQQKKTRERRKIQCNAHYALNCINSNNNRDSIFILLNVYLLGIPSFFINSSFVCKKKAYISQEYDYCNEHRRFTLTIQIPYIAIRIPIIYCYKIAWVLAN